MHFYCTGNFFSKSVYRSRASKISSLFTLTHTQTHTVRVGERERERGVMLSESGMVLQCCSLTTWLKCHYDEWQNPYES